MATFRRAAGGFDIRGKGRVAERAGIAGLAAVERLVAGVAQHRRQQGHAGRRSLGPRVSRNPPQRPARDQHRAAGQAHGRNHRAHAVGVSKMKATLDEPIEVGRLNFRVAQRANRVPALVVGQDQQDVRTRGGRCFRGGGAKCQQLGDHERRAGDGAAQATEPGVSRGGSHGGQYRVSIAARVRLSPATRDYACRRTTLPALE